MKDPQYLLTVRQKMDEIQSELAYLRDLLTVCRESLSASELHDIHKTVVNVLYFGAETKIDQIIKEIKSI